MAGWKEAAAARGVELNSEQAARLEALDSQMALLMEMIGWQEEPIQTFRLDAPPAAEPGQ